MSSRHQKVAYILEIEDLITNLFHDLPGRHRVGDSETKTSNFKALNRTRALRSFSGVVV
jgi:hypothetical protein